MKSRALITILLLFFGSFLFSSCSESSRAKRATKRYYYDTIEDLRSVSITLTDDIEDAVYPYDDYECVKTAFKLYHAMNDLRVKTRTPPKLRSMIETYVNELRRCKRTEYHLGKKYWADVHFVYLDGEVVDFHMLFVANDKLSDVISPIIEEFYDLSRVYLNENAVYLDDSFVSLEEDKFYFPYYSVYSGNVFKNHVYPDDNGHFALQFAYRLPTLGVYDQISIRLYLSEYNKDNVLVSRDVICDIESQEFIDSSIALFSPLPGPSELGHIVYCHSEDQSFLVREYTRSGNKRSLLFPANLVNQAFPEKMSTLTRKLKEANKY